MWHGPIKKNLWVQARNPSYLEGIHTVYFKRESQIAMPKSFENEEIPVFRGLQRELKVSLGRKSDGGGPGIRALYIWLVYLQLCSSTSLVKPHESLSQDKQNSQGWHCL